MKFDVIVSGMNVVDILVKTPSNFQRGGKQEVSDLLIQGGAPAGNAACVMSMLGLKTAFLGYSSNTSLSMIANHELERCNVDTSLMIKKENHDPAIAVVEVNENDGERTVFYSLNNYSALSKVEIKKSWVNSSQLVFVDGYDIEGSLELLTLAQELGIPSVLDIEAGNKQQLISLLSLGKHCIIPLEAARFLSEHYSVEACLKNLSDITQGQIIITDGENGCWAEEDNHIIHQPAFNANVVDTTGCGDSFHGAYAYALLNQKTLRERISFASGYAALVAQYLGGRTFHPTEAQVYEFIKNNTVD